MPAPVNGTMVTCADDGREFVFMPAIFLQTRSPLSYENVRFRAVDQRIVVVTNCGRHGFATLKFVQIGDVFKAFPIVRRVDHARHFGRLQNRLYANSIVAGYGSPVKN